MSRGQLSPDSRRIGILARAKRIRTPEQRRADIAKREANLRRDKARMKQQDRREHERKLRDAGAVVEQAGALDWPKEKLLAAIRNALGNGAED